ncbi:hypothetical protein MYK68_15820 [Gordonia sp. PP30]|uniref:hypothetical protein n=1 Tax=Gordonia sp. PP30 TaxID=2935861 RepID=UPI001FFEB583|nr:hypothetical protein [Gordonia sp. PP30]UQE74180.1 hypothetical protein MYK68_15820 [Gordonia sp. PP30]
MSIDREAIKISRQAARERINAEVDRLAAGFDFNAARQANAQAERRVLDEVDVDSPIDGDRMSWMKNRQADILAAMSVDDRGIVDADGSVVVPRITF